MVNILNGLLSLGMLLSGCVNTISKKNQNDSYAPGWNRVTHKFTHPWFQTIIMFLGEALCIFGYFIQRRNAANRLKAAASVQAADSTSISLSSSSTPPPIDESKRRIWQPILLIPTALDLLGTTFGGIGLVYCTASVWQMLRGSIIVFTGVLSWLFLKRKMLPFRWVAITFTIAGLLCVGVTGILNARDDAQAGSSSDVGSGPDGDETPIYLVGVGILLILAGQLVCAAQMVVEEKLLKGHNFQPMHIVGVEGILGTLVMAFIVLPILFFIPGDHPSPLPYHTYENSLDAILQIVRSWKLVFFSLLYLFSIAFYNFFGLSVTKHLTCVHRTLIDACRTIVVWTFQLFMHYVVFPKTNYGEKWTRWSYIQVIGFVLLIIGTVLYNAIVKIPFMEYDAPAPAKPSEKTPLVQDAPKEETDKK